MNVFVKIISRVPLKHLYRVSDYVLYPLLYHVIRYRRKMTRQNLILSFPEKSLQEIITIERRYYHFLADLFVEIPWGSGTSPEEMKKHFIVDNMDEIEEWILQKGGLFFMLGHLGNWEWTPEVQRRFTHPEIQHYNICRRQKNKTMNDIMMDIRKHFSGEESCIEKSNIVRHLVTLHQQKKPFTIGLISDQKVQPKHAYYRTEFLHQDTTFLGGGEVLATKFDWAVSYVHIHRVERGVYRLKVQLITLSPKEEQQYSITEQFVRMLEANIREQPELWLWTHNRWKWERLQQQEQKK